MLPLPNDEGPQSADRRRATRYPVCIKALVCPSNEAHSIAVNAWTRDISRMGMFLEWNEPRAVGTMLNVELELPVPVKATPGKLLCRGRVMRIDESPETTTGAGIEIIHYEFKR